MSLVLTRIDDPRDSLERARKRELVAFAQQKGIEAIRPEMPAILIRRELRKMGLTRIDVPNRPLGGSPQRPDRAPGADENVPAIDASDDLARQFAAAAPPKPELPARVAKGVAGIKEIARLRKLAHSKGIKIDPHDTIHTLRMKIGVEDAAR